MAKFLMAGGGTGGHVLPLVAVARELRERGHDVLFVGTRRGLEAKLVPEAGFPIEWIEAGGLSRTGWRARLTTIASLPGAVWQCFRLLERERIAAVFSLGGYAAGPAVAAAILRRTPVVAMEPNAVPGLTNRLSARWVHRALLGWPETARYFPEGRTEVTGVPIRREFFDIAPRPLTDTPGVLITGGSQGSRTLNNAFRESWPKFRDTRVFFLHQCGAAASESLQADFAASGVKGDVRAFIPHMAVAVANADLVVGRAGASAVAELAAAGKPSILVPFPFAADDHQTKNAEAMARAGGARLVSDREMNGDRLHAEITELTGNPELLERMATAARSQARPGAALRAAEVLEQAAAPGKGPG